MTVFYVLALVSMMSNGQKSKTEVTRYSEVAPCIEERDAYNEFAKTVDMADLGYPDQEMPKAKCFDRYGNEVSGEI